MIDWNDDGKHDIQDDMQDFEAFRQTESKDNDTPPPIGGNYKKPQQTQESESTKKVVYKMGGLQIAVIVITIILFIVALFDDDIDNPFSILGVAFIAFCIATFLENN